MSRRNTAWLAWFVWALSVVLNGLGVVFEVAGDPSALPVSSFAALLLLAFATVAALVASRRPENSVGWLLCTATLCWALGNFTLEYGVYALIVAPGSLPGGAWMAWLGSWARAFGYALMVTFLFLLFPTGRLPSPRWQPVAWLAANLLTLTIMVHPHISCN